ncbi:NADH oxidase [alpha proteobacterium AAP81b]|nr:NADH oxidase [alpha proteobacterium AAP81b]
MPSGRERMTTMRQLRSRVTDDGHLELRLAEVPMPEPRADEVLIRIEATPINPSDIGLLFGAADMSAATASGTPDSPVITAPIGAAGMRAMAARVGQSLPCGNEGAGTVVAAGSEPAAQALIGRKVAAIGGAMYADYRAVRVADVLVLPDDASAEEGASCFVNPLTALGFVETLRRENHKAIVHTAAASNLGQMLVRISAADGIPLVNIVRSAEQVALLKTAGAEHVLDSTADGHMGALIDAIAATEATLAFDAIGGGRQGGQILTAMEAAVARRPGEYNRYGSNVFKQLYIYGGLDTGPTEFNRGFGFAFSISGWLLFPFLAKAGAETTARLKARVAAELKTTFASHYSARIGLAEALDPATIAAYNRRATGTKYLITPN